MCDCDHPYMARIQTKMPSAETTAYCNNCRKHIMRVGDQWAPYTMKVDTSGDFTAAWNNLANVKRNRGAETNAKKKRKK